MEKISGILFLFIVLFLVYSYFSFVKKEKTNKQNEHFEIKKAGENKENEKYDKYLITAVIASLMEGKKYKIRNIFKEKTNTGTRSAWKLAGRNYNMQRRERI